MEGKKDGGQPYINSEFHVTHATEYVSSDMCEISYEQKVKFVGNLCQKYCFTAFATSRHNFKCSLNGQELTHRQLEE